MFQFGIIYFFRRLFRVTNNSKHVDLINLLVSIYANNVFSVTLTRLRQKLHKKYNISLDELNSLCSKNKYTCWNDFIDKVLYNKITFKQKRKIVRSIISLVEYKNGIKINLK